MSREKFETFLIGEYEWAEGALNAAIFCGDDATGHYVCGEHIYDRQDCSECLFWAWRGWQAASKASEQQLAVVVAENAESEKRMQQLIQVINNADNDYCMCGDAMKNHAHGGCGHPTGMFDYYYNQWLESGSNTPATDAHLAEVRAQGVEMLLASLPPHYTARTDIESFAAQLREGKAREVCGE